GQGQGHRGRHPRPWRYHAVRSAIVAATRRTRRPRRGRPATMAPPPMESGYRLVIEVEALANPEEDKGWTVLASTIDAGGWPDVDILQAYQDQNTTVEPGFRWIKVSDHRGSNSQALDFEGVEIYPIFTVKIESPEKSNT